MLASFALHVQYSTVSDGSDYCFYTQYEMTSIRECSLPSLVKGQFNELRAKIWASGKCYKTCTSPQGISPTFDNNLMAIHT